MQSFELLLEKYAKPSYIKQGLQNEQARYNLIQTLLTHQKLPKRGWNDQSIELFIAELSALDSNNFMANCGVGEREGRVYSSLVATRHYHLSHGIGRSGDIAEVQPKAAGSSIIYKLTVSLVHHAMEIAGIKFPFSCLALPLATGMTITMSMIALKKKAPAAKYVIWPRIDQKSCFKSISTAGLIPLVVENLMENGQLETDTATIEALIKTHGSEVLCVLSTTSCFAPRQPDQVDKIARICKQNEVPHIINNAYGVQCAVICKLINRAVAVGRVDAVIQSTDKNFLVPVGGAVVLSPDKAFIDSVSSSYPGRANMNPILDLFITLLSMGEEGYRELLLNRELLCQQLRTGIQAVLNKFSGGMSSDTSGLSILPSQRNTISIAVAIDGLLGPYNTSAHCANGDATLTGSSHSSASANSCDLTFLGSMLYQRSVSGCRVVPATSAIKSVAGCDFQCWGAHYGAYPHSYFTAACSIGITQCDVTSFLERIEKVFAKFLKRRQQRHDGDITPLKDIVQDQNEAARSV